MEFRFHAMLCNNFGITQTLMQEIWNVQAGNVQPAYRRFPNLLTQLLNSLRLSRLRFRACWMCRKIV